MTVEEYRRHDDELLHCPRCGDVVRISRITEGHVVPPKMLYSQMHARYEARCGCWDPLIDADYWHLIETIQARPEYVPDERKDCPHTHWTSEGKCEDCGIDWNT